MKLIVYLFAMVVYICTNGVALAQEVSPVKLSNLSVYRGTYFEEPTKTSSLNLSFLISNPDKLQQLTAKLYKVGKDETVLVEEKTMPLVMFNGKRVVKVGDVPFLIFNNKVVLDWFLAIPVELNNYVVTIEGIDSGGLRTLVESVELSDSE